MSQENKITEADFETLLDLLPHGSGINGKWNFTILKSGGVLAGNCFSAMNEVGFYCHDYDFTLTIHKQNKQFICTRLNFHGQKENLCCGYDLKSYILEIVDYRLEPKKENMP